jgi:hypothetical protein
VLGQKALDEKSNEITAILALPERIDLEGALVSVYPMGCNPGIAPSMIAEVDYLLAVKDDQQTLHPRSKSYFDTAPSGEVDRYETLGKDHGKLELPARRVSHVVDWDTSSEHSGASRLPKLNPCGRGREPDRARTQDRDQTAILCLLARDLGQSLG